MLAKILAVAVVLTRVASADPEADGYACKNVKIGPKAEPATLCSFVDQISRGTMDEPVYRVQIHRELRVVRAKKTVTLIDVVDTVSVLDKHAPTDPDILNLTLDVARDGMSVRLREVTPGACAGALAGIGAPGSDPWKRLDHDLITRACARRGRWVWSGTAFVRAPASRRSP